MKDKVRGGYIGLGPFLRWREVCGLEGGLSSHSGA